MWTADEPINFNSNGGASVPTKLHTCVLSERRLLSSVVSTRYISADVMAVNPLAPDSVMLIPPLEWLIFSGAVVQRVAMVI